MVLSTKAICLLLFSLTLLALITSSAAVIVIAGQGALTLSFASGALVGALIVLILSLEKVSFIRYSKIAARVLLQRAPMNATDILLEIECRRLLDRMGQLLERSNEGDRCLHCQRQSGHAADCPVPPAATLYAQGKAKRVPWRVFKERLFEKRLSKHVVHKGETLNGDDHSRT